MRDKSMRRTMVLLVTALFLSIAMAACGGDEEEPEAETLEEAPQIFLIQEGEQIMGREVVSCWPEQTGDTVDTGQDPVEICEDTALPTFEDAQFTELSLGQPLQLQMEEPLPDRVVLVLASPDDMSAIEDENEISVEQSTISWEPGVPAGDYVLAAMGFWEEVGGATYYFPVSLQE